MKNNTDRLIRAIAQFVFAIGLMWYILWSTMIIQETRLFGVSFAGTVTTIVLAVCAMLILCNGSLTICDILLSGKSQIVKRKELNEESE